LLYPFLSVILFAFISLAPRSGATLGRKKRGEGYTTPRSRREKEKQKKKDKGTDKLLYLPVKKESTSFTTDIYGNLKITNETDTVSQAVYNEEMRLIREEKLEKAAEYEERRLARIAEHKYRRSLAFIGSQIGLAAGREMGRFRKCIGDDYEEYVARHYKGILKAAGQAARGAKRKVKNKVGEMVDNAIDDAFQQLERIGLDAVSRDDIETAAANGLRGLSKALETFIDGYQGAIRGYNGLRDFAIGLRS